MRDAALPDLITALLPVAGSVHTLILKGCSQDEMSSTMSSSLVCTLPSPLSPTSCHLHPSAVVPLAQLRQLRLLRLSQLLCPGEAARQALAERVAQLLAGRAAGRGGTAEGGKPDDAACGLRLEWGGEVDDHDGQDVASEVLVLEAVVAAVREAGQEAAFTHHLAAMEAMLKDSEAHPR